MVEPDEPAEFEMEPDTDLDLDAEVAIVAEPANGGPEDVALVQPPPAIDAIDTEAPAPAPAEIVFVEPVRAAPGVEAIVRTMEERLSARLDALQQAFDREIRAEATREKVVDRLHAELQEYKHDLLLSTLRPIFLDLVQLHDDIGKMVEANASGDANAAPARLLDVMRGFQQGVEDILYRQGVESFVTPEESFDPKRQRAVSTVATDDPALARTIASRLRKGFQTREKVIRPEIVTVYAHKPTGK